MSSQCMAMHGIAWDYMLLHRNSTIVYRIVFFFCKISYFVLLWDVVQLILVEGVWKSPKLTKYGLKFCPEGFGVVDVFR